MKLLATAVFAGVMAISTVACAKEEPKKVTPAVSAPAATPAQAAPADVNKAEAPKTKRVCLDVQGRDGKPVIDPKTGKPKQNCTTVKIREKFEGTKIEDAKKK
jgi:hypothetical protein